MATLEMLVSSTCKWGSAGATTGYVSISQMIASLIQSVETRAGIHDDLTFKDHTLLLWLR